MNNAFPEDENAFLILFIITVGLNYYNLKFYFKQIKEHSIMGICQGKEEPIQPGNKSAAAAAAAPVATPAAAPAA